MGALLARQAWIIFAMHMINSRILSTGQWEEQVCCAEGRHCCLGRVPLLHPLGLMGTLFLKSLYCCHFSCLTSPKHMLGVQLLLSAASATALRAVQERAGIIPSCAAELGRETLEGAYSVRTSGAVDIKMLQKSGLISPETVSGKDWE